jgi:tetratricopeptide (TPR) repeat protein
MTTILSVRLIAVVLAMAAGMALAQTPATDEAPAGGRGDVQSILSAVDAKWQDRDEPDVMDAMLAQLKQAEKLAPNDYGVLWRLARHYFWASDNPAISNDEKSRLGKIAWDYGDKAAAANPKGVEGWYFAAVGMGNYSLGIGILKALGEGIEGKFKDRLSKAEAIDPNFYAGGIYNAWGRFYYKLPWPKYDARKSEQNLQKAIKINPANVRGRIFLAELYQKEGHPKEARKLLEEAIAHPPGAYDLPEERRSQKQARELLAEMKK